jgi:hypothetical protein
MPRKPNPNYGRGRASAQRPDHERQKDNSNAALEDNLSEGPTIHALPHKPMPVSQKGRAAAQRPPRQRQQNNGDLRINYDSAEETIEALPRRPDPARSGVAALTSRVRPRGLQMQSTNPQVGKCDGKNCQLFKWARGAKMELRRRQEELNRKEMELAAVKETLQKARLEIRRLNAVGGKRREQRDVKQESLQIKISADEQKRRDRVDATERKQKLQLEAKRDEREHKRAMKELETPEERRAAQEAKKEGLKMAGKMALAAGSIAMDAREEQRQTQRVGANSNHPRPAAQDAKKEGLKPSGKGALTAGNIAINAREEQRQTQRVGLNSSHPRPAVGRRSATDADQARAPRPPPEDEKHN